MTFLIKFESNWRSLESVVSKYLELKHGEFEHIAKIIHKDHYISAPPWGVIGRQQECVWNSQHAHTEHDRMTAVDSMMLEESSWGVGLCDVKGEFADLLMIIRWISKKLEDAVMAT